MRLLDDKPIRRLAGGLFLEAWEDLVTAEHVELFICGDDYEFGLGYREDYEFGLKHRDPVYSQSTSSTSFRSHALLQLATPIRGRRP